MAVDSRLEPHRDPHEKNIVSKRVAPETAWRERHWIQLNTEVRTYVIVIDVDCDAWAKPGYPLFTQISPSWYMLNHATGRAQIAFVLKEPVHHGPGASPAPQAYLDHIWRELVRIGKGDPAAMHRTGLFRNPHTPGPGYMTYSGHDRHPGFELSELFALVDRHKVRPGMPITVFRPSDAWADRIEFSRNCRLFYYLDWYGHRHAVDDESELLRVVKDFQDLQLDSRAGPFDGKTGLDERELGCIVRSVAKRVRRGVRQIGSRKGCRARREGHQCGHRGFVAGDPDRDRRIVQLAAGKWTQRRIAAEVGVSQPRVCQVLKQHYRELQEELRRQARELSKQGRTGLINGYTGLRPAGVTRSITNNVTRAAKRRKTQQQAGNLDQTSQNEVETRLNTEYKDLEKRLYAVGLSDGVGGLPPKEGLSEAEQLAYGEGYARGRAFFEGQEASRRWRDLDS